MFLNQRIANKSLQSSTIATTSTSLSQALDYAESFCIVDQITDATPAAKTFVAANVNTGTSVITITANTFATGLVGQFTSTGTLPAGLSTSTNYYIIALTADTFKVATSLANALVGTAVTITDTGSGGATHTFTATALAGASGKVQLSLDGTVWSDMANSSISITVTTINNWDRTAVPGFNYVQVVHTCTAGQLAIQTNITVKART